MNDEPLPAPEQAPPRTRILDIGAGDPEAPANAIPNIIADLVETETWRNAAAVLTGALLIGLGYWAYNGIRDAIAETRVTSLEALLGTVVTGLDVWVGEHRTEAVRLAKDPVVVERAKRLATEARDASLRGRAVHHRGGGPGADTAGLAGDAGGGRLPDRRSRGTRARLEGSRRAAASACARRRSGSGSTSRSTVRRSSCAPSPIPSFR